MSTIIRNPLSTPLDRARQMLERDLRYQRALAEHARRTPKSINNPTTLVRGIPKVGRNEPCPCRSGRKFKHCHGRQA